jgi:hypothetical protein
LTEQVWGCDSFLLNSQFITFTYTFQLCATFFAAFLIFSDESQEF